MKQKKPFTHFVNDVTKGRMNFQTRENMQDFIQLAIEHYELKSFIKFNILESKKVLYIASIAEENTLTKLVQLAMDDENVTIESVFEGYVIRRH